MNAAVQALAGVRALSPFRRQAEPPRRGYHVTYRADGSNICPGCGRRHWWVGRLSAECAFCTTALPIEGNARFGPGTFTRKGTRHD